MKVRRIGWILWSAQMRNCGLVGVGVALECALELNYRDSVALSYTS